MHTPRRLAVLLATFGLVALAGCADDDGDRSLAVGDDPPATTVGNDTVPATEAPIDTLAVEETAAVETTVPATDEEQIRYAFETWILPDTPTDVRVSLMEGGEDRRDVIEAGFEEHAGLISAVSAEVDTVTFVDADHAEVVFRLLWGDGPSPYFPDPLTGLAVRVEDGSWRVSRDTLCALVIGALGGPCDDPTATSGPSETTAPGPGALQPVVLWVTNSSFSHPSVDLVLAVDGVVVASGTYHVEDQHTVVEHPVELPSGPHLVTVETADGTARAELVVEVDDPEWVSVAYWGPDGDVPEHALLLRHSEVQLAMD
jgi:hypothetical protein